MIRAARADPAARVRVARLLAHAELEPDALPSCAILVVRSLRDPLPAQLRAHAPAVHAPRHWERAVKASLTQLWRDAARPAQGAVPADAAAVLFADTAEMLAAFARDACAGAAAARWWWPALLRGLPGTLGMTTLTALWVREARHVPAAIARLHSDNAAASVAAALTAEQATRVLTAVAHAWGVAQLLRAPDAPRTRTSPRATAATGAHTGTKEPPWHVVPGGAPGSELPPEQRALLGVCTVLYHAPLLARSTTFAQTFAHWRAAAAPYYRAAQPPTSTAPTLSAAGRTGAELEDDTPEGPTLGEAAPGYGAGPTVRTHVLSVGTPAAQSFPHSEEAAPAEASDAVSAAANAPGARSPAARESSRVHSRVSEHAPQHAYAPPHALEMAYTEAHSSLCGAFFLIHALRDAAWFERAQQAFPLSPVRTGWAWLELAARALLPPAFAPADALWRVLAQLDGRDEHTPLDNAACDEYLRAALPPLRARLCDTLRAFGDARPLHVALFERAGRIQCTAAHVDVYMRLDDVTLPVRISGLDANPGWVPELARVVTFHYAPG